ncbi:MAG: adenylate kinase family protein [Candidatus Saccharimonadales bacterium]
MILLMGIAGSGKGTQGKMLADRYGFHLISMGDIVRMYVTGDQRKRMLNGELLDDTEVISIVDKVLSSIDDSKSIILDGFPRTIPQAEWLIEQQKSGRFSVDIALHLRASSDAVRKRLIDRARIDDTNDAIDARFKEYETSTTPLLAWLENNRVKVLNIDAERSVEEVNAEMVKSLQLAQITTSD